MKKRMLGKVFKVCEKDEWENVKHNDFFEGSQIDRKDGFIHFSTSEQIKGTLENYFKSKSPLYLLEVNTDNLDIVWEVSRNKQQFPHLYEPLPLSAVTKVYNIFLDNEGNHIISDRAIYVRNRYN